MPLTGKGAKILANMKQQYGPEKGESVFYAAKNAGTIAGVDEEITMIDTPTGMITGADPLSGELDCGPPDRMPRDAADQRAELPPGLGLHQASEERTDDEPAPAPDDEPAPPEPEQEDAGDGMIEPPALLPTPAFEHPAQHPNASAPPEPAIAGDEASMLRRTGGYGGIVGGAIEQKWGDRTPSRASDALPSDLPDTAAERTYSSPPGLSLGDIQRDGENRYWGFWQGGGGPSRR